MSDESLAMGFTQLHCDIQDIIAKEILFQSSTKMRKSSPYPNLMQWTLKGYVRYLLVPLLE